jgi:hypothetical protein
VFRGKTDHFPNLCFSNINIFLLPVLEDPRHAYCRVQDCIQCMCISCLNQRMDSHMHCNYVCLSTIHSTVIHVSPVQPRFNQWLQTGVILGQILPPRHEHLKCGDSTRQDRSSLAGHHLLYHVRDLLVGLQSQYVSHSPLHSMTYTQNNFQILHYSPLARRNPVLGKFTIVGKSKEVIDHLLHRSVVQ